MIILKIEIYQFNLKTEVCLDVYNDLVRYSWIVPEVLEYSNIKPNSNVNNIERNKK